MIRALASSNQRMLNSIRLMPSYAFSLRVAPPLVAGSIHDRGLAAPTSLTSLSIVVTMTMAIAR